ncbi:HYR domain-containing protein [Faecalibaculum rodentium]|uniref:HYR domain-containing protein n=1 Tax=Faecalibaculum rodentium TaxID=1702221 RepID=UPI0023F1CBDF|nr:HYR domain-containing protein [Faecalibaculum rodentium]
MPDERISENTINTGEYEMTFDEINTQKLGPQELGVVFSIPDAEDQTVTVTVVDREAPEITLVGEGPFSMDLQEVRDRKFDELYTVSDNCSAVGALEVRSYVQEETFDFGQTVTVQIHAKDSSGNEAEASFEIQINPDPEEEQKKQEEEKKQESSQKEQQDAASDTGDQTTRDEPVQQPTVQPFTPGQSPSVQTPVQQSRPKPANKQFLFSDGYNMNTAPSACSAELAASGYPGSCIPMQGSDGLYTGMQLIFD